VSCSAGCAPVGQPRHRQRHAAGAGGQRLSARGGARAGRACQGPRADRARRQRHVRAAEGRAQAGRSGRQAPAGGRPHARRAAAATQGLRAARQGIIRRVGVRDRTCCARSGAVPCRIGRGSAPAQRVGQLGASGSAAWPRHSQLGLQALVSVRVAAAPALASLTKGFQQSVRMHWRSLRTTPSRAGVRMWARWCPRGSPCVSALPHMGSHL